MEIDEKLIYELLEWCVGNIPETKQFYAIDALYPDDFVRDIKCIDINDTRFLPLIVFHLKEMTSQGYFNMGGTTLWIYGISTLGQSNLTKLRNTYNQTNKKI